GVGIERSPDERRAAIPDKTTVEIAGHIGSIVIIRRQEGCLQIITVTGDGTCHPELEGASFPIGRARGNECRINSRKCSVHRTGIDIIANETDLCRLWLCYIGSEHNDAVNSWQSAAHDKVAVDV